MKRRDFIATAALSAGGLGAAASLPAFAAAAQSASDRTLGTLAGAPGKMFEYAICAELFWPDLPFMDRLVKISESGFKRFEFWRFRDKDIDAMAKLCQQHGLIPQQFVVSFSINSAERRAQFLQDLEDAVVVADKLGIKMMTAIPGAVIEGVSYEDMTRDVIQSLREAEVIARKADITLMIEAVNVLVDHPGQSVTTSQQAAEIVQAVDSPHVRLLFDPYHLQISEGNLSGNIEKYKDLIVYYQLADHPGRHEPGTGEINHVHLLQTIKKTGYTGPIGLECKPKTTSEEALRRMLEIDAMASGLSGCSNPSV